MKYNVGDRVRIKSLDWYNENKDEFGNIDVDGIFFTYDMVKYCSKILTITNIESENYVMQNCPYAWSDGMIEELVEEETLIERVDDSGLPFNEWLSHKGAFYIPDGYELKDENGNVINATKIVLEKKKKEYPKTYKECCDVLGLNTMDNDAQGYKWELIIRLQELLIARDAYWKIAGEEMGLGKPWEPDWNDEKSKYTILVIGNKLVKHYAFKQNYILAFPTAEIRDAFYENFKELIEFCKELL